MITMVQSLPVGNAIRLFLKPPASMEYWRVLKKPTDTFGAFDDPAAMLVYEGDDTVVLDTEGLINDVAIFYRPYYFNGLGWTAGVSAIATPSAKYEDLDTDVQSFVRERIAAGLLVEVERGNLQNDLGYIEVYTAPPSVKQGLRFPLVTVHLDSEDSSMRAVGEDLQGDTNDFESEGWFSSVSLTIVGWSLNSDERIELRRALRRIIIANLPVFDSRGMINIDFRAEDVDALSGEYNADIYQVMITFSCLAPMRVGRTYADYELVDSIVIIGSSGL